MRPDFVILGVPRDEGVMVLASTDLSQAELSYQADLSGGPGWARQVPNRWNTTHTLTTDFYEYVMITAPTYGEALRTLFEQWSPEPAERTALAERRAVEA